MDTFELKAKSRALAGKQVADLREKGYIPAVIYGPEFEPLNIMVENSQFIKLYNKAGTSKIIDIFVDENKKPIEALIQDVDYNPVTNFVMHADFYKFREGHLMDASIALKFINEPKPVKEKGAILLKSKNEIDVRCLPKNLISEIEVDLSQIKTLEDVIKVKDLKVPDTIEVKHDPEEIIALTKVQEEEKAAQPLAEPSPEAKEAKENKEENKKQ